MQRGGDDGQVIPLDKLIPSGELGIDFAGEAGAGRRVGRLDEQDPSRSFIPDEAAVPVRYRQDTLRAMNLHATLFDALEVCRPSQPRGHLLSPPLGGGGYFHHKAIALQRRRAQNKE